VDKHRVIQILINLLANAINAIKAGENPERRIVARLACAGDTHVQFVVTDTGIGIPAENLTRIFSHGFTTRHDGHGFGLHSGANAARSLGGSLTAASPGPGLGASFTLVLPMDPTTLPS
jgi:two-component system NtrC family sensor kinase